MKAKTTITLPTGVRMDFTSQPYFDRGDAAKSTAKVEIVHVEKRLPGEIEVTVEIDVDLIVTLMNDRGQRNPNLCVSYAPETHADQE